MVGTVVELAENFRGLPTILVGSGPSIDSFEVASQDKRVAIFFGDAPLRTELRLEHNIYVRANSISPSLVREDGRQFLEEFGGPLLIASTVMESVTPVAELLPNAIRNRTYLFDQRHFFSKDCEPPDTCCRSKLTPTIQEAVAYSQGLRHLYSSGSTVFLHALALAVLMRSEKIAVVGVDLPLLQDDYRYGNHSSSWPETVPQANSKFLNGLSRRLLDLEHLQSVLRQKPSVLASYLKRFAKGSDRVLTEFGLVSPRLFADAQYLVERVICYGGSVQIYGRESNLRFLRGVTLE